MRDEPVDQDHIAGTVAEQSRRERFRVILLDKRGTGLSDRTLGHGSSEDRIRDVLAVMDAAGSSRASIVGISEGGPIALMFAGTYPERVDKLVLYAAFARMMWAPDHPVGLPSELADPFLAWVEEAWGKGKAVEYERGAQSLKGVPGEWELYAVGD